MYMHTDMWLYLTLVVIVMVMVFQYLFSIETFDPHYRPYGFQSRSVELYNPSIYSGMFVRKYDPLPYFNTRESIIDPLRNPISVTKHYTTHGTTFQQKTQNLLVPLWNLSDVYPLVNRKTMLMSR